MRSRSFLRFHGREVLRVPADHAPQVAPAVDLHRVSFPSQLFRTLGRESLPDELRRLLQRRIVGADLHLRDQRDDLARRAGAAQRILDRLLDHVADPSRRRGDEHAEWKRARLRACDLVADQLVADLWSVAVHHDQLSTDADAMRRRRVRFCGDRRVDLLRLDPRADRLRDKCGGDGHSPDW